MRTTPDSSFAGQRSGPERRRHERIAHDALELMVQQMPDGVLVVDHAGTIRFANPAAAELFGRTARDLDGQPLGFPVLVGESAEIELLRPTGEQVAVELRTVEFQWKGAPATLLSLRDITDRRALEHERLARTQAEAGSEAKSEFLALMSHELRTPLNAVIGYAELLSVDGAEPISSAQHAKLARILASAKHLRDLVDQMLDLAEAGEGRLHLGHASAPAARPANAALEEACGKAQKAGVELATTCVDDDGVTFAGDEERVQQILALLLDNAIKFTPRGGRVALVCERVEQVPEGVRHHGAGQMARWRVTDTGIGIAADQVSSIFDPFMQVDGGHTREHDGSGLGLTIGRSLARLMGGDLTVESEPKQGSTFSLWLPAA
ncbi:MAG TPA: ATP-binding protein [Gemmatimonadaceae bacterium]|nr:ATP-binding protein [Gemmatimonadaceae bacterium]